MSDIFPYFQPIVDTSSGLVAGYEALARRYAEDGSVQTAAPIFTDQSLSSEYRMNVDRSVRRLAMSKIPELADGQFLSVNLSPEWIQSLDDLNTTPTIELVRELGVNPSQVMIEITELNGDLHKLLRLSEMYRREGMKIAIDDFGAGFSQLDRVADLSPDIIKLDMRLFKEGMQGGKHGALVQLMGELGARLGTRIVCEGVETEEEFNYALQCNASYVQGFLFSPATEHLMAADHEQRRVHEMISHYFESSMELTARQQWRTDRALSDLLSIRQWVVTSSDFNWLANYQPEPSMLRFYICDMQGFQCSPNYEYCSHGWVTDSQMMGHNWSWRPYFYQLLAQPDMERRIMTSSPYLDIATGQFCHTLSVALGDGRILLADIRDQDPLVTGSVQPILPCYSQFIPE